MIREILGRLFAPRCPLCRERVWSRFLERHLFVDHAGEVL